jgi:hypothetical protein
MKGKFIIQDWAGNRMFPDWDFTDSDEAWDFAVENVENELFEETGDENDDALQDIFIVPVVE